VRDAADTDANDVRHHSTTTSMNGPGLRSRVRGDGDCVVPPGEDSVKCSNLPLDINEVQTRLESGEYTSIVCTPCRIVYHKISSACFVVVICVSQSHAM